MINYGILNIACRAKEKIWSLTIYHPYYQNDFWQIFLDENLLMCYQRRGFNPDTEFGGREALHTHVCSAIPIQLFSEENAGRQTEVLSHVVHG